MTVHNENLNRQCENSTRPASAGYSTGRSTLIAVTRAHEGFTPALTWSPDGALIAVASFNDRMLRIWELAQSRTCRISGYSMGKLDFRMSFATQFNPNGSIARLIIPQLNCPEAEGIVADEAGVGILPGGG